MRLMMKSNLQRHELDKGEDTEATYFNLGVFRWLDDAWNPFELQYIKVANYACLKCSLDCCQNNW